MCWGRSRRVRWRGERWLGLPATDEIAGLGVGEIEDLTHAADHRRLTGHGRPHDLHADHVMTMSVQAANFSG